MTTHIFPGYKTYCTKISKAALKIAKTIIVLQKNQG